MDGPADRIDWRGITVALLAVLLAVLAVGAVGCATDQVSARQWDRRGWGEETP